MNMHTQSDTSSKIVRFKNTEIAQNPSGSSKTIVAANPIIPLIMPFIYTAQQSLHPHASAQSETFESLHQTLTQAFKQCEQVLWRQHLPKEHLEATRILLCAWLDEQLTTPDQPHAYIWKKRPFSERLKLNTSTQIITQQIIETALSKPIKHLNIIEIIYLMLSMGLTRTMASQAPPSFNHHSLKYDLYTIIRHQRTPSVTITYTGNIDHSTPSNRIPFIQIFTCFLILLLFANGLFTHSVLWQDLVDQLIGLNL